MIQSIPTYKWLLTGFIILFCFSCDTNNDVIYDQPFVYLTDKYNGTASTVDSEGRNVSMDYDVNLRSKTLENTIEVYYEIVPGDGVQEGVDYLIPEGQTSPVKFEPCVFQQTIHISWLRNALDDDKDNSIYIRMTDCNVDRVILGRLGPDQFGKVYTITK